MKIFEGTPFKIGSEKIDNGPGVWKSTKVNIYYNDVLIGDYIRNYDGHEFETFYPFKQDQWYALYSKDYTSLSVMKIYEDRYEHWCDYSDGFCPVEIYIPSYNEILCECKVRETIVKYSMYTFDNDNEDNKHCDQYCEFGLLSGCHWGDDSSWKIRYIDLSKIKEKQLIVEEKFGYWEQADALTLKQSINMSSWGKENPNIKLCKQENFQL